MPDIQLTAHILIGVSSCVIATILAIRLRGKYVSWRLNYQLDEDTGNLLFMGRKAMDKTKEWISLNGFELGLWFSWHCFTADNVSLILPKLADFSSIDVNIVKHMVQSFPDFKSGSRADRFCQSLSPLWMGGLRVYATREENTLEIERVKALIEPGLRTHITEKMWERAVDDLEKCAGNWGADCIVPSACNGTTLGSIVVRPQ